MTAVLFLLWWCSHSFGSDGCSAVGPLLNRVALSFRRLWRASYQSGAVAVRRSIETKPVYSTCLEALHVARVTRGSAGASVLRTAASDGSVSAESLPRSLSLCSSSQWADSGVNHIDEGKSCWDRSDQQRPHTAASFILKSETLRFWSDLFYFTFILV